MGPVRRELAIVDVQDLDLLVLGGVVGDGVVIEVVELEGCVGFNLSIIGELGFMDVPGFIPAGVKVQPGLVAGEGNCRFKEQPSFGFNDLFS